LLVEPMTPNKKASKGEEEDGTGRECGVCAPPRPPSRCVRPPPTPSARMEEEEEKEAVVMMMGRFKN
jgi:hypothetical protein